MVSCFCVILGSDGKHTQGYDLSKITKKFINKLHSMSEWHQSINLL